MRVISDEPFVQLQAFLFQYTYRHVNAGLTEPLHATPLYLGKRVDAAADYTAHAFADNQVGTGRCLAVMGTRLEADIHRCFVQQSLVLFPHRCKSVHFCVSFAAADMIAFTDNPAILAHNDRPHHRVRLGQLLSVACQLQAAAHIDFVSFFLFHIFKIPIFAVMTYQDLWHRLTPLYDDGEAQAIIRLVLEVQFGISLTDIYTGKVNELSRDEADGLEKIMSRLERAEPVQYVLGYAMFCGRPFHVASGVLIPRPETEVLCRWIEEDYNRSYCALQPPVPLQVLDVGTGSGCVAVSLALDLYNSALTAWDVSGDALLIARENIHRWNARVELKMEDALHPSPAAMEQQWDIIVSNPPYICNRERAAMAANVLEYEPETALFVPDDDPLQFYRAVAEYGVQTLSDEGVLYFETNPLYINKVKEMLDESGYKQVMLREDQFGKLRFTKALRP